MALAFQPRNLRLGALHRFWIVAAAVVAFLLAALWAQPIG